MQIQKTDRPIPEISAIVPIHNEGQQTETILHEWICFLEEEVGDYELIAINDGSLDGTGRILDRLRQANPKVRVIHQLRGGYAAALKRGFESARGHYVLQFTASGRYEPSDAKPLLDSRKHFACITGYRTHRLDGIISRSGASSLKYLLRWVLKLHFEDAHCALRIVRQEIGKRVAGSVPKDCRAFNAYFLIHLGMEVPNAIKEVAVPFRLRKNPKGRVSLYSGVRAGLALLRHVGALKTGQLTNRNYIPSSPQPQGSAS